MTVQFRKSNFELLRIISMILILMSHCDDFFGLHNLYRYTLGGGKIIADLLHIGGQIGVGCFILISGFFMIEQTLTAKKILRIAGEVWFYTISIWFLWVLIKSCQGNFEFGRNFYFNTLISFFPILFSHYWFVTAYIILLLLSPFLNKLIFALDYHNYRKFLFYLITIFIVLKGGLPFVFSEMIGGRLFPVIIIYFISGYLRRFRFEGKNNAKRHFTVSVFLTFLLFASFYTITFLGIKLHNECLLGNIYYYRVLHSPFVIGICVELFIGFMDLDIKYNKIINEIAGCTFGVYLLHQNILVIPVLCKLFPIYKETRLIYIFGYSLVSVFILYFICTIIDYIRKKTIEPIWLSFIERNHKKIQDNIRALSTTIYDIVTQIGKSYYKTK